MKLIREVYDTVSLVTEGSLGKGKDYFIEGASIYEMRPNGVGEEPYFLKKASPLQMCIFEIFKQLK